MKHRCLKSRNRKRTLYLHIGIPKTASTWLQSNVFSKLHHLHYLDCSKNTMFRDIEDLSAKQRSLGNIFSRSIRIWEKFGDTIFEDLIGDQQAWLKNDQDLLISDERIGRQGSRSTLLADHFREMKQKAGDWGFERIHLICMIRRQDHWLASHYAQMSDRNPQAGQEDFKKLIRNITSPYRFRYGFGMLLEYNELYDQLSDAYGDSNLLMLPYEELKQTPAAFLESLLGRLGTPSETIEHILDETSGTKKNVRSEQDVWQLRNKRKRVAGIPLPKWIFTGGEKTIKLMPEYTQQVFECYSAGNRELALKTGLNLEEHGYFGPGSSSKNP
ncbi:hypothetical protein [Rhodohalobacter sp. 8-1]|uniref:hypothetical protein n=1 Tax=Rhodohalobacter sp. 8-1 TaxID=3131972 RepID=UPI0030EE3AF5